MDKNTRPFQLYSLFPPEGFSATGWFINYFFLVLYIYKFKKYSILLRGLYVSYYSSVALGTSLPYLLYE